MSTALYPNLVCFFMVADLCILVSVVWYYMSLMIYLVILREGKYIPLPQRQREMNRERAERGSGGPQPHNRLSGGYRSTPPSPRPPIPSASGPQPGVSPADRNSPLSGRGGAYIPHHPQGSPSPSPGSGPASPYTPASPGGQASTPTSATAAPSPSSPPSSHGHSVPHSHSLPHSLSEAARTVNGGMFGKLHYDAWTKHSARLEFTSREFTSKTLWCFFFCLFFSVSARTSPKAQRPSQSRTVRATNSLAQSTGTFRHLVSKPSLH